MTQKWGQRIGAQRKDRRKEKGGGKVQRTATEWRKKNKTNSTLAIGSNTHS